MGTIPLGICWVATFFLRICPNKADLRKAALAQVLAGATEQALPGAFHAQSPGPHSPRGQGGIFARGRLPVRSCSVSLTAQAITAGKLENPQMSALKKGHELKLLVATYAALVTIPTTYMVAFVPEK